MSVAEEVLKRHAKSFIMNEPNDWNNEEQVNEFVENLFKLHAHQFTNYQLRLRKEMKQKLQSVLDHFDRL